MYWSNISTYSTSIFYVFLFCTALNIPIVMFINPIVNWLTSFSDIDADEEVVSSKEGYIMFALFSLINLPMFITLLYRHKIDNANFITNHIYEFFYVTLIVLLSMLNPAGLITGSEYQVLPFMVVSMIIFGLLKQYVVLPVKEVLLVLGVIALSICGTNMAYNFFKDMSNYAPIVIYALLYILGYLFVLTTVPLSVRIDAVKLKVGSLYQLIRKRIGKVSTILAIEIFVIFMFFYIRSFTKTYYGGTLLIHEPIPLDIPKAVTVNDSQYHYSVSFWLYINATSPSHSYSSSEYTDVMVYGDNVLMAYNALKNSLQVIMKNEADEIIETIKGVHLQKWNHFVFSYANGIFDIFMNGELLKSNTLVPKMSTHEIMIGAENGVNGDLCNMLFFNKVLTKEKIASLYSHYKLKNPPIL